MRTLFRAWRTYVKCNIICEKMIFNQNIGGKMRKFLFLLIFVAFLFSSCATQQKTIPIIPEPQVETIVQEKKQNIPDNSLDSQLANLTNQIVESLSQESKSKIAVIEFSDLNGNITEFGMYLSEELITRLFLTRKFDVIERQLLNQVISEQKLGMTGLIDDESAIAIGKLLGVDAIVSGTITDLGKSLKVNARLIATETGSVFAVAATEIFKDEKVKTLINRMKERKSTVIKKKEKIIEDVKEKVIEKPEDKFIEGLTAEYFNFPPFSNNPGPLPNIDNATVVRVDNSIDFNWGEGVPAPNISADYFGVRWTGYIHFPITGTYLFRLHKQDGARLFINNIALFEDWHSSSAYNRYNDYKDKNIFLKGDKWYSFKIEFFEVQKRAWISLEWRPPGFDKLEVIPSSNFKTKVLE